MGRREDGGDDWDCRGKGKGLRDTSSLLVEGRE